MPERKGFCDYAILEDDGTKTGLYRCRIRPGVTARRINDLLCQPVLKEACALEYSGSLDVLKARDNGSIKPPNEPGDIGTNPTKIYEDTRFAEE